MKKKLYSKQLVVVLVLMIISLQGMEKEDNFVYFGSGKQTVVVPEYNLKKMGLWDNHYKKNKKKVDKGLIIPLFKGVSLSDLQLVNKALNQHIDNFSAFYKDLSFENKQLLIKLSGQYDDSSKQLMLNIPLLTIQLMEEYFPKDIRTRIKNDCHTIEQEVINHFTLQLMHNSDEKKDASYFLLHDIDYRSLWMPYEHIASQSDYEIPLFINDKQHKVYASYFATDTYEYRIVDKKDKECSLWVVDHNNIDNKDFTFSVPITHKAPIKGSCYEKIAMGYEYVVTYSSEDIVISRIKRDCTGSIVVQEHRVMEDSDIIFDVCINGYGEDLIIGVYQGYNSRVDIWSLKKEGILEKGDLYSFEDYGLLKKIFATRPSSNFCSVHINHLFVARGKYFIDYSDYCNNDYIDLDRWYYPCDVMTPFETVKSGDGLFTIYKNKNNFIVCDNTSPLMDHDIDLKKKNNQRKDEDQSSFFNKVNYFSNFYVPTDCQRYYKYSSDGKFLLCCTFVSKFGCDFIKTILMNARTREFLVSDEKLNSTVRAVGFSPDGKSLVFSNKSAVDVLCGKVSGVISSDSSSLSCRQLSNEHTQEIEASMSSCMLNAFLLRYLCSQWKKDKYLDLNPNDVVYTWLSNVVKSFTDMSNFLTSYFPDVRNKK